MFLRPRDLVPDARVQSEHSVYASRDDLTTWGQSWLDVLGKQTGISQIWLAEVCDGHAPHWVAQLTSEAWPTQFTTAAIQAVLHNGRIFTFSDQVELRSGGLFHLVHAEKTIGVLGLLSHQMDYLNQHARIWLQTLTRVISESLYEEITARQKGQVSALIFRRLQSMLNVQTELPSLLEELAQALQVSVITILRFASESGELELFMAHGLRPSALARYRLPLEGGLTFRNRQPYWIEDVAAYSGNHLSVDRFVEHDLRGYCAVPLFVHERLYGVLEFAWREPQAPDQAYTNFLLQLASQIALALEHTFTVRDLQQVNAHLLDRYTAILEGLSRALELRDLETNGHTQRVSQLTLLLAEHMHYRQEEREFLREGALLHDIGKIGIPDAILLKPGSLDDRERAVMEQHVLYGFNILTPIIQSQTVLDIVRYHHERWDGTGYPHKLTGEQIPLPARLFAVVDVFDALTSDRPYRMAWTRQRALDYILEQAGQQFDPQIVQYFMEIAKERKV